MQPSLDAEARCVEPFLDPGVYMLQPMINLPENRVNQSLVSTVPFKSVAW
jgi:hypothetical protein